MRLKFLAVTLQSSMVRWSFLALDFSRSNNTIITSADFFNLKLPEVDSLKDLGMFGFIIAKILFFTGIIVTRSQDAKNLLFIM